MSLNGHRPPLDELAEVLLPFWQEKRIIILWAVIGAVVAMMILLYLKEDKQVRISIDQQINYDSGLKADGLSGTLQRFRDTFHSSKNYETWSKLHSTMADNLAAFEVTGVKKDTGGLVLALPDHSRSVYLDVTPKEKLELVIRSSNVDKISAARGYALHVAKTVTNYQSAEIEYQIDQLRLLLKDRSPVEPAQVANFLKLQTAQREFEQKKSTISVGYSSPPISNRVHPILFCLLGILFGSLLGALWVFIKLLLRRMNELGTH